MFKSIIEVFSNVASSFSGLPAGKKVALMAAVALVLASLVVLSLHSGKPDMEVLFSKLSNEDMGEISAKLKEQGVNYKITTGGTAVLVPSKDVFGLRIQLASKGLPRGSVVGFEIFDKTSLGMTEFVQKLNLRRAITGELTRTINSLDTVESARIHIAVPEKSLFLEEEREATASVVLKLSGRITPGQVQGIVHLVASSVERLTPEGVTIVDIKGNILAGGQQENLVARLSLNQFSFQQNMEKVLENRIKTILGDVLGPDKISAKVSVDLDFKQTEETEEIFDPESQVARSEQRSEESNVGALSPGGIVGATANQPGGQEIRTGPTTPSRGQRSDETVNYEINKIVKHTISPVGEIKRLSIAVMVDGTYDKDNTYVPRKADEMRQFQKIIEKAVGYDEDRGDQIEVLNVAFNISQFQEGKKELEKAEKFQFWIVIGRYAVTTIFIVLLFVMLIKPLIAWLKTATSQMSLLESASRPGELEGGAEGGAEAGKEEADELKGVPKKVDYRQFVQDYAKDEPTHTAELVRKLLKERK